MGVGGNTIGRKGRSPAALLRVLPTIRSCAPPPSASRRSASTDAVHVESGTILPDRRSPRPVSEAREKLTAEICRERAAAFRASAAAEPDDTKKEFYLALADAWTAMEESYENLSRT
jgi:hypothetical protein